MDLQKQAQAAFEKIIEHGPSSTLRKAAKSYWSAYQSAEGADDKTRSLLDTAIKSIPVDYRSPALQCLEACDAGKAKGDNVDECYLALAICLAERIVHVM